MRSGRNSETLNTTIRILFHRNLASARIRGFCDYFSASLGLPLNAFYN